ncbi:MAG TPA: GntP family permease [Candidatus Mediterraneibacter norfolkensis]|nr:GntP family permease [Candidatus Mediterraneibacter norfolkensis]
METIISVLGLLAAAVIFIVVIWKGLDVFTSTILVSFIIIITSWMQWWDALTSYASGYVGFIQGNLFVLVIGAVFGELMGSSGCAEAIANVITEKLGVKRVILSITVISTVFVYVGVSGFVVLFVLAPIATVMMKQAGYPYRMIPGIIFIGATCSAMIPYAINITNIMPAQYLGTSMGSAPILGWIAFAVSIAVGYFYMVYAARKAAVKEGTVVDDSKPIKIQPTRDDLPSVGIALIPFVLAVVLVLIFSNFTEMDTNAVVVLSLFIGSAVIVLTCHKQLDGVKKIIGKGVDNGIGATIMAAAILGFSGVLQSCPGFQAVIDFVLGLNMNAYITEFIGLNILAGIMGSGTSAIAMFFEHLSDGLIAQGADPGALHRLAPACATGMNTLPNAGGMVAQLRWMNLSLAESYWYVFVTSVLAPMIGSAAAVVAAIILY